MTFLTVRASTRLEALFCGTRVIIYFAGVTILMKQPFSDHSLSFIYHPSKNRFSNFILCLFDEAFIKQRIRFILDNSAINPALLQQVAAGDEAAFSIFYRHFQGELQPVAWRCRESGIEPAEVLQLTFMKAWLNRERLPEITNLKAWLIRVAYREYLMAVRKKLSYEDKLSELAGKPAESGPVTPFHVVNYNELKRCAQEVIDNLPPQRKAIYQMSRDEGLKIDEIAQRLNISPNTVKSALQTVLKLIREKLIEAGYGPFAFIILLQFLNLR